MTATMADGHEYGWHSKATAALLADCALLDRLTLTPFRERPCVRLEAALGCDLARLLVGSLRQHHGLRSCLAFRL